MRAWIGLSLTVVLSGCSRKPTDELARLRQSNEELRRYVWEHAGECPREPASLRTREKRVVKKRAFERKEGLIRDRYRDENGREVGADFPASMLDEPLSEGDRSECLQDVAEGSCEGMTAAYSLMGDESDEFKEALLKGLENDKHGANPGMLIQFVDDPRVRPALLRAFERADPSRLSNFAQALGGAGGPGAVTALRKRLMQLVADPETWKPHEFFNDRAGSLASTAHAMLELDREAVDAAEALARLLDHPTAFNRESAAGNAVDVHQRAIHTTAVELLRKALRAHLDPTQPKLYCQIAAAFSWDRELDTVSTCAGFLAHDDPAVREQAEFALVKIGTPAAQSMLLQRLRTTTSKDQARTIAGYLGDLVPAEIRVDIARDGLASESPMVRWMTIATLHGLPKAVAAEVAREALNDEPDPGLRKMLEKHTS